MDFFAETLEFAIMNMYNSNGEIRNCRCAFPSISLLVLSKIVRMWEKVPVTFMVQPTP